MRSRSSSNRGRRNVGSQKMEHQKNIHLHPPQKSGSINRGREVETKGKPKQHPKGSDMEKTGARKAGKEKKRSSKQPTAKNRRHGGQTVATT